MQSWVTIKFIVCFLPYIVLLEFLNILRVDGCDNGFDHHRVDPLLEGVLLPFELLVLLELEDLAPLGIILDYWIEEIGFFSLSQLRLLFPAVGRILDLLRMGGRNSCFPPHLVVTKWILNVAI